MNSWVTWFGTPRRHVSGWISGGTSWQIMLVPGGENGKNLEEWLWMMAK